MRFEESKAALPYGGNGGVVGVLGGLQCDVENHRVLRELVEAGDGAEKDWRGRRDRGDLPRANGVEDGE